MNSSIDISEIKNGMKSCLENASELIKDAELLLENKRFARTHTLTQLAIEEIGKSMMLYEFYNSLQMDKRKEFDFKKFRKNFRDHKWKTFETKIIDIWMFAENKGSDFDSFAKNNFKEIQKVKEGHYDNLKNESLYVSLKNDKFCKPNDLFTEIDTSKFLEYGKRKVEFITDWTLKWLDMDEWLGADKEGIVTELQNDLKK
ncbi:AbiV family abortive infection protein [Winogradskyella marincola]|uniref:AbiV family abortive infection protein n=1 Tax=Winogradskyella marincola TaxID=3037795 RepID=A0ABT6FYL8_9FLAO|nr:AbiV family abortive infection protein [Winogradskyella sp. YYF002]MDG4714883.1 AbiV family abortive infection protein [Winogradskyella sp. YYF002]